MISAGAAVTRNRVSKGNPNKYSSSTKCHSLMINIVHMCRDSEMDAWYDNAFHPRRDSVLHYITFKFNVDEISKPLPLRATFIRDLVVVSPDEPRGGYGPLR